MKTTMSVTIRTVADTTLQYGVLYSGWMRENGRGAWPCRPISEPMPLAARMLAFEALTILNTAPATMSDRPTGPRKPAATRPMAVSPSSAMISAGTGELTIETITNA
jgi:hypothetical protein